MHTVLRLTLYFVHWHPGEHPDVAEYCGYALA